MLWSRILNKPDSLRLSHRRLAQINAIADALDVSATEAIAHMIRKEVAAGTIPAEIPGFVVKPEQGGVSIRLDDGERVIYSAEAAREMAATIRETVAGQASVFNVKNNYSFIRIGRGFKLRVPLSGPEVSMTGDLAVDLAGQIAKAAA